jgi:hypothetical protein
LPTSDSLSGAISCIELRSLRTANEELDELAEEDELAAEEPPVAERPVAAAPVPVELEPDPLAELLLDPLVVPLPETTSPT